MAGLPPVDPAAVREFKERLMGGFPPGVFTVLDAEDDLGLLLQGLAELYVKAGDELVAELLRELCPLTATIGGMLPAWERALGLTATEVTVFGSQDQRRRQVIARLRERGPMTYGMIRAVVAPLLDYADPSTLKILEVDRDALRAAHTYSYIEPAPAPAPITRKIKVLDDALVGPSGVQIDISGTITPLEALGIEVISPTGVHAVRGQFGRQSIGLPGFPTAVRVCLPELAGVPIFGDWTIILTTILVGNFTRIDLFAEGVGRDSKGNDGRGAIMGEWAALAEPHLVGPNASIRAADAAIQRINYATRRGLLAFRSADPGALPIGDFGAIPDNVNTLPNRSLPGSS